MTLKSISDNFQKSLRDVELVSKEFKALTVDESRIRFILDLFQYEFNNLSFSPTGKCPEKSRELRETGNFHFRKGDMWKALDSYTESIAYAPHNSVELSLALGNRSAALLHLNLVREALKDVEITLRLHIANDYQTKMLERREKCLKLVKNSRSIHMGCENVSLPTRNTFFDSASAVVCAQYNDTFGRYLIAGDDVKPGDILIIEKPFSSILVANHLYTHCSNCFKRSFNLLPCPNCVTNMYCSEECISNNKKCHRTECKVLQILTSLQATTLTLLSVKVLTDASQQGQILDELFEEIMQYDKNNNKQTSYNSLDHINIYNLVGNTEKRSNSDLFQKSLTACIIITVLDKIGNFFGLYSGNKKKDLIAFAGSLILRYLQSMPCNAHEISEYCDNNEEIGAGVYATLSLINHSCDPNVVRHSYRDSIVLRAIRPIKMGEQLFDNYGFHYALLRPYERQCSLMKQYYFQCECEACIKLWPMQHDLPETEPVFKAGIDMKKYELNTQAFKKNIDDIFHGENDVGVINDLVDYLSFLDEFVERPWKAYNICQEAIKHCLSLQGNSFRLSKGVQKVT